MQAVSERIDKMRQSSSFDVDEEMRGYIQNPELQVGSDMVPSRPSCMDPPLTPSPPLTPLTPP